MVELTLKKADLRKRLMLPVFLHSVKWSVKRVHDMGQGFVGCSFWGEPQWEPLCYSKRAVLLFLLLLIAINNLNVMFVGGGGSEQNLCSMYYSLFRVSENFIFWTGQEKKEELAVLLPWSLDCLFLEIFEVCVAFKLCWIVKNRHLVLGLASQKMPHEQNHHHQIYIYFF